VNNDDLENSSNDSEDDVENVSTVHNIEINISGNTDGEDQLPKTPEYQSAVRKCTKKTYNQNSGIGFEYFNEVYNAKKRK